MDDEEPHNIFETFNMDDLDRLILRMTKMNKNNFF